MNNPSVSVIVPVYNGERYLKDCIESLIKQSRKDIEIILVDNASTDRSGVICDEYKARDNRILVIHRSEHGWISDGRNDGLKKATGRWITFVDADDWIDDDCFEKVLMSFQNSDADIICEGGYYENFADKEIKKSSGLYDFCADTKQQIIEIQKRIISPSYNNNEVKPIGLGAVWNKLYRRDFLNENSIFFAEDVLFSDDSFFNFNAFCYANKIVGSAYIGYHYRQVSSSISNKYRPDWNEKITHYLIRLQELMERDDIVKEMNDVYQGRVITGLIFIIRGSCFHKDNPYPLNKKMQQVRELKKMRPYSDAIVYKGNCWLTNNHLVIKKILQSRFVLPLVFYVKLHDLKSHKAL